MLSGSFNPLHSGHEGILEQAVKRLSLSKENYVYEVAVNNVDKTQMGIE
jgi:nicotinic acid mononucleotide adenylyltransferase